MKTKAIGKQAKRLAFMLSLGGLNGSVALAAIQGLFRIENAVFLAVLFMAGPGALVTASLIEGVAKERMLAALLAGIFATIIVMFAAGIGPKLLSFTNVSVLKVIGGISIGAIALLIAGIKIPENLPFVIMIIGLIASPIWR